jgi:hypothetical protein
MKDIIGYKGKYRYIPNSNGTTVQFQMVTNLKVYILLKLWDRKLGPSDVHTLIDT